MSMPASHARPWTPEGVRALQDESRPAPRYELIDGELIVTPSPGPSHQVVLMALVERLLPYVKEHQLGYLLTSPADLGFDATSVVQPDLFVVPAGPTDEFTSWRDVTSLLLAVEILSPATARHDRGIKRDYYQRHGVPEYWVVHIDARLVERWRPDADRPEVVREALFWQPRDGLEPLRIALPALFRPWGPHREESLRRRQRLANLVGADQGWHTPAPSRRARQSDGGAGAQAPQAGSATDRPGRHGPDSARRLNACVATDEARRHDPQFLLRTTATTLDSRARGAAPRTALPVLESSA